MGSENISTSLASSLLDAELEADRTAIRKGGTRWKTGNHILDSALPKHLWSGGHIIGVGGIDDARTKKTSVPFSLPLEIITTHLLTHTAAPQPPMTTTTATTPPSIFILCPPAQTTVTIQRLHSNLQASSRPRLPKFDPKTFLNDVSLLQYLDISGLLESLAEVSTSITSTSQTQPQRRILLIQGLTATLAAMQRRHGTVQAAAMMTSVAAALGALRGGGLCLCLVELGVRRVGDQEYAAERRGGSDSQSGGGLLTTFGAERETATVGDVKVDVAQPVLRELVERAMDVVVLVHDAGGRLEGKIKRVVEVVKDERVCVGVDGGAEDGEEVFSALGSWVVWN